MGRIFHAIALGLAGAGIVHIAALLLVPHFASNDAWSRISALGPEYAFAMVEPAGPDASGVIEVHDPEFAIAACRFDLERGLVHEAGLSEEFGLGHLAHLGCARAPLPSSRVSTAPLWRHSS